VFFIPGGMPGDPLQNVDGRNLCFRGFFKRKSVVFAKEIKKSDFFRFSGFFLFWCYFLALLIGMPYGKWGT
jgi:hypothetical protein